MRAALRTASLWHQTICRFFSFSGRKLHKNASLCNFGPLSIKLRHTRFYAWLRKWIVCNCWPFFEQTIAYGVMHIFENGSCPCRQVKRPLQLVNLPQANYCSYVAKVFKSWRSKQELNPHLRYRKPPFYPLDYWSIQTLSIIPYQIRTCLQVSGSHQGSGEGR